jgi:hypothetical protein
MEYAAPIHRKIELAGALFGLALASVLLWTTQIAPTMSLSRLPIDAPSYGLSTGSLAGIIALTLVGVIGGGYLVARFWEQTWAGVLSGAIASAIVQIGSAYLVTSASLEGNQFAELILFRLPLGLIIGGLIWFIGGIVGSAIERIVLGRVAPLFQTSQRALLGFALMIVLGAVLGYIAGGSSDRRNESIAAAQAVDIAFRQATGQPVAADAVPAEFFASEPAKQALAALTDQAGKPYQIIFIDHDGREVVTVVKIQDGPAVRCVSTGPVISRCFPDESR